MARIGAQVVSLSELSGANHTHTQWAHRPPLKEHWIISANPADFCMLGATEHRACYPQAPGSIGGANWYCLTLKDA